MEKEIVSIISSLCIIPLNGLLKFLRDGNDTPTKLHVIDASVVAGTEDFDFTKELLNNISEGSVIKFEDGIYKN